MRIGTWNLQGKWGDAQATAILEQACEVWLLTELPTASALRGYAIHGTDAEMVPGRWWAAVAHRGPCDGHLPRHPHPASVSVDIDGIAFCCSVLPWRTSGGEAPWSGADTTQRTVHAVASLLGALPPGLTVWGGDWNHALDGPEHAGSSGGRRAILDAVATLELQVLTTTLLHRHEGHRTIDHVAVPAGKSAFKWATRVEMVAPGGRHLSDHDAYVAEVGWL